LLDEALAMAISPSGSPALDVAIVARTVSASDGTFMLTCRGPQNRVRLRLDSGPEVEYRADFEPRQFDLTLRLVLGGSSIEGVVRDVGGTPQPGIVLRLLGVPRGPDAQLNAWLSTDSSGHYRFSELTAGTYELLVGAFSRHAFIRKGSEYVRAEGWPSCTNSIVLLEADRIALDVGTATGAPNWRGSLKTPAGRCYAPGKVIRLTRESTSASGSKISRTVEITTHKSTGFEVHVEPGEWRVSIGFTPKEDWPLQQPLVVGPADVEHDLVVPGTLIRGLALDAATGRAVSAESRIEHVRIRPHRGSFDADSDHDTWLEADGKFTLLAHGKGDWVLEAWPMALSNGKKRMDLHLDGSGDEFPIEIEIRTP
jgi:hypothetical protein